MSLFFSNLVTATADTERKCVTKIAYVTTRSDVSGDYVGKTYRSEGTGVRVRERDVRRVQRRTYGHAAFASGRTVVSSRGLRCACPNLRSRRSRRHTISRLIRA